MPVFDPDAFTDESIRDRYRRDLRRGENLSETMAASFPDRAPVQLRFIDDASFNAYAWRDDRSYVLELGKAIPLFLLILFEKLLANPTLFPWLPSTGDLVSDYEIAFILDPADFSERSPWQISLTESRSFTAGILTDITCAFVQMHELGHVMCGHIEANEKLTGHRTLMEMVEERPVSRHQLERERAWEADADSVAASLLINFISQLIDQTRINAAAAAAFGRGDKTVEHVLAITVVSLYAMFAYFQGARFKLGKRSSHAHPFVRSFYVKDMLLTAARREWPIDLDVLGECIDARLAEMLEALDLAGITRHELIDDRYLARADRELEHITRIRAKHRRHCRKWAWFPWTETASG